MYKRLVLIVAILVGSAQTALAGSSLLVQFDPKGRQISDVPVLPMNQAPFTSATSLSETGFIKGWFNNGALPVGLITSSSDIKLDEYISFEIAATPGYGMRFDNLLYDKISYFGSGATRAAIRSSADGFSSDVSVLNLDPAGVQSLKFDLGSMPFATDLVEFRIYFYASPKDRADWDDLLSSDRPGYNGLRLVGEVLPVPEPTTGSLLCLGFGMIALARSLRAARERSRYPKGS